MTPIIRQLDFTEYSSNSGLTLFQRVVVKVGIRYIPTHGHDRAEGDILSRVVLV